MSYSGQDIFSLVAQAAKPKLYNWKTCNDASDDWIPHGIAINAKWSASGCLTVANRYVQEPLLLPIPPEPVAPVGNPLIMPGPQQLKEFNYFVMVHKGLKDTFDKATKIHKEAQEGAEKAYNDFAGVHAPNSVVITRFREIQRERKAEAMRIVADLGRLGFTYEAAMVLIGVNAPGNAAVIAILQPISCYTGCYKLQDPLRVSRLSGGTLRSRKTFSARFL